MSIWKENADSELSRAIAEQLNVPAMVEHYILVVGFIDQDDDRMVAANCAPDDRTADSLGLLAWADGLLKAQVVDEARRGDG